MTLLRAAGLAVAAAATVAAGWYLVVRPRPVAEPFSERRLNVEIAASGDTSFIYWGDFSSDTETVYANALGDSSLVLEHSDGEFDLRPEDFDCSSDAVVVTGRELVPLREGDVECVVQSEGLTDTLSLRVGERGSRLFVAEIGARGP